MKIELDIETIEVPEVLEKEYLRSKAESDEDLDFIAWWYDNDKRSEYLAKICDEAIAEFVVAMETALIPSGGGYPIDNRLEFEDNGFSYTVIAFGWTSFCEDDKGSLNMIGFKRKKEMKRRWLHED